VRLTTFLIAPLIAFAGGCASHRIESNLNRPPTPEEMAELWVEPKDLEERDLFHGAGGARLAPDPAAAYRYVKEKTSGKSPGYTVEDPKGIQWSVKLGPEAQSEVAASRLLWAIGYHQPPVYLLKSWSLNGGPNPGSQLGPGRFRPDAPGWKEVGPWNWYRNPFVGTQPYRGLIVLMRIINNWDLLNQNNLVYDLKEPVAGAMRLYVVKDLGASFGKTTFLPHQGTKNVVDDFEEQEYIDHAEGGIVRFEDKGRRHRALYEGLTTADVRWTSSLLARLRPKQWQDAFRAAGYDEPTANRFIRKLQEKVAQGLALP
jgi:hypothetical protein